MCRNATLVLSLVPLLLIDAIPASAQTTVNPPERRAAVALVGGLSAGSSTSGAALGATLTFDLTDRVAVEGTGSWLQRGGGADAVSLNLGLLFNLVGPDRRAVPYLAAGGGLYRATFDMDNGRFFGQTYGQSPAGTIMMPFSGSRGFGMMPGFFQSGVPFGTGPAAGPIYFDQMPMFYAQRLGQMMASADGRWGMRSFTDPALSLGGGIWLNLTDRVFARPDVRALVILNDGDSSTLTVFAFNIGYRF